MGELLTEFRELGVAFETAWPKARSQIIWPHDTGHRRQWRIALEATRGEWQACYELRPTKISKMLHDARPEITLALQQMAA